jgi:hypothetical protein
MGTQKIFTEELGTSLEIKVEIVYILFFHTYILVYNGEVGQESV